jgi:hypothetical protein
LKETRSIEFWHPIKGNVGPSGAQTTRHQTYRRFGSQGFIIENTTKVKGIPAADCFQVQDRWVFEQSSTTTSDNSISMTVSFHITFTKRTMLKPIIEKNIRHETKSWFQGYVKMVMEALGAAGRGASSSTGSILESVDASHHDDSPSELEKGHVIDELNDNHFGEAKGGSFMKILATVFVIVILVIGLEALHIRSSLKSMEGELASMKYQNEVIMQELQKLTMLVASGYQREDD